MAHQIFYEELNIKRDCFEMSHQAYSMDPVKRAEFEEQMAKVVAEYRKRETKDMTKAEILTAVTLLEEAKFKAQQKMYNLVRSQRMHPGLINSVIKTEELKAGDDFFNETGFEEADVEPSIKKLGLTDDEEISGIVKDYEKKSAEFLEMKKKETENIVQKFKMQKTAVEKAMEEDAAKKAALEEGEKKEEEVEKKEEEVEKKEEEVEKKEE